MTALFKQDIQYNTEVLVIFKRKNIQVYYNTVKYFRIWSCNLGAIIPKQYNMIRFSGLSK